MSDLSKEQLEAMYTVENWLNDKIKITLFPDFWSKKSRKTYSDIRKMQKDVFDKALKIKSDLYKSEIENTLEGMDDPLEYLDIELRQLTIEKNNSIDDYKKALTFKDYLNLTGKEYKYILDLWDIHTGEKTLLISLNEIHCFPPSVNFNMRLLHEKIRFINKKIEAPNKKNKTIKSYEDYFKDPEKRQAFENALQAACVTINGNFQGIFQNEILEINIITLVLYQKDYLSSKVKKSHRVFFGKRFGLAYNEKSYRTDNKEYSDEILLHKKYFIHYSEIIPTLI